MGKLLSIARNTFVQSIRQPIYCIVILGTFAVLVLMVAMTGWTMGEGLGDYHDTDQKMLQNLGLSILLWSGLILAAFSASRAVGREIEDRTALTVISKPVSRAVFLLGKFAGVTAAVGLAYYLNTLVFLLTVRHQVMPAASDPYDWPVIVLGTSALGAAVLAALAGNFFFGWSFPSALVRSLAVCLTAAFALVLVMGKGWQPVVPGFDSPPGLKTGIRVHVKPSLGTTGFAEYARGKKGYTILRQDDRRGIVDVLPPYPQDGRAPISLEEGVANVRAWPLPGVEKVERQSEPPVLTLDLLAGVVLSLLGVWVFVAVAVAASARLGGAMTLLVCVGVFFVGFAHPFLTSHSEYLAVRVLGWGAPNLTYFYSQDALSKPYELAIPFAFVAWCALYALLYVAGVLAVGIAIFHRRQMDAEESGASVPGAVSLLAGLGRIACVVVGISALILLSVPRFHTAVGLIAIGLILALVVAAWFYWGFFARGARWTYWVAGVLAILALGLGAACLIEPRLGEALQVRERGAVVAVLGILTNAAMLLILLLPKTRYHFRPHRRFA